MPAQLIVVVGPKSGESVGTVCAKTLTPSVLHVVEIALPGPGWADDDPRCVPVFPKAPEPAAVSSAASTTPAVPRPQRRRLRLRACLMTTSGEGGPSACTRSKAGVRVVISAVRAN